MRHSKKLAALALAAGVAVTATAAFAYWTSTGSGNGDALAGTSSEWDVTSETATGLPLTPGGPIQNIVYNVANDSSGHQQLNQVVASVEAIEVYDADGKEWIPASGCSAADFAIESAAAGADYTINPFVDLGPAGSATDTFTSNVDLQMVNRADTVAGNGSGNQDECKNVRVTLAFDAS